MRLSACKHAKHLTSGDSRAMASLGSMKRLLARAALALAQAASAFRDARIRTEISHDFD